MKTAETIQFRLNTCEGMLERKKREHDALNQIDMLSGEGNALRESMNQLKGQITALNWVLQK